MKLLKSAEFEALMMAQQWGPLLEEHHRAPVSCKQALAAAHQDAGEARAAQAEAERNAGHWVGHANELTIRLADAEAERDRHAARVGELDALLAKTPTAEPELVIARLEREVELADRDRSARDAELRRLSDELVRLATERDTALGLVEQLRRDTPEWPAGGINDESTRGDQ